MKLARRSLFRALLASPLAGLLGRGRGCDEPLAETLLWGSWEPYKGKYRWPNASDYYAPECRELARCEAAERIDAMLKEGPKWRA